MPTALSFQASLPDAERWLRIDAEIIVDRLILGIGNGGIAIPESMVSHIFERGYSTKGQKGSGLGLSISWRILQRVYATIELDQSSRRPSFKISLMAG